MRFVEVEVDQLKVGNGLAAYINKQDAEAKSAQNRLLYTEAQQSQAQEFYSMAYRAYSQSRVYLTYRQKFIAIKIEQPAVIDIASADVRALEDLAGRKGIKMVKTEPAHNLIYRIPRGLFIA